MDDASFGRQPAPGARRIPAIVNADAGTASQVREALERADGFDVRECHGGEIAAAVEEAIAGGHARLVVAGGDGTIATAAGLLAGRPTALAIVPGGTLNHFARDHGIPDDIEAAVELARHGRTRPTDLARVNGHVFLNTSSVGAYVTLVRFRDRLERWLGYTLASFVAAVRVFFTMHRFVVEISGPDGPRTFRTPLLFLGVGERELKLPTLGARVDDGRAGLHVMVVKGRTRGAVLALAFSAATRGIRGVPTPHLETVILDECTVRLRRPTAISTDGEIVQLESPLRYELLRGALQLVRP
ncbi:MAG TPA: diacylglycerol kinase family protein [Gemmatimonadaceae bacterium]|nr:diacylglycerol kinase family protein [Gemmatimonadaceae bacterium]